MWIFLLACGLNAERSEADKPQDTAGPDDTAEPQDTADCIAPTPWFADSDGDGFGNLLYTTAACDQPDGYVLDATDCDDTEENISPTAPEYCDGVDQNCNGETDEGAAVDAPNWYADVDVDGFGDAANSLAACAMPTGYVELATDCDDAVATTYPDAEEYCNNEDDNCDGEIDESAAIDALIWYADTDADGFGDPSVTTPACEQPAGYSTDNSDCDDTRADANPAALEVCNGLDDDCDAYPDDNPTNPSTWHFDADFDGYGRSSPIITACDQPASYAPTGDDCDDVDPAVHPGAAEYCDDVDADCDGELAEDDSVDSMPWFADLDGDGFGDAAVPQASCELPESYVADDSDCDDADAGVFPNAVELCNGKDDDCEGSIDEGAVDAAEWYADTDGDGFGVDGAVAVACEAPVATANLSGDCDDTTSAIHPDVVETCADLTDLNCDGAIGGVDGDGDGVKACEDCDDIDAEVNSDADEVCGGGDENCDGLIDDADPNVADQTTWYGDADGDGFGDATASTESCDQPAGYVETDDDCDDSDDEVSPEGVETCDDGTDQDCDGADLACPSQNYTTDWGSEMIAISAGSFTMGGGAGDPDGSYTDHVVTLTHDFWIGETEITRGQWESSPANATWTYGSISSGYPCTTSTSTEDCPADTISWYDVAKYANALSAQEGLTACYLTDGTDLATAYLVDPYACPGYRMPTEAEWEYAARAGQDTEFSGSNTVGTVAWYRGNAYDLGTNAHQVATLAPNAWGLYDMSGNVYEWTNDWYSSSDGGYGNGAAQTDPAGPTSGSYRVFRGGGFSHETYLVRVAGRNSASPGAALSALGARLSRSNP